MECSSFYCTGMALSTGGESVFGVVEATIGV